MDKVALDKYITNVPDDGFETYVESVIEAIPDEVYNSHEDWFLDGYGECNSWLNTFFRWQISVKEASEHIVKIFKLIH